MKASQILTATALVAAAGAAGYLGRDPKGVISYTARAVQELRKDKADASVVAEMRSAFLDGDQRARLAMAANQDALVQAVSRLATLESEVAALRDLIDSPHQTSILIQPVQETTRIVEVRSDHSHPPAAPRSNLSSKGIRCGPR